MKKADGKLFKCMQNRRGLLKLFPEKKDEYKKILKNEHLKGSHQGNRILKSSELIWTARF